MEQAAEQLGTLGNATRLQVCRTLVRAGRNGLQVSRVEENPARLVRRLRRFAGSAAA